MRRHKPHEIDAHVVFELCVPLLVERVRVADDGFWVAGLVVEDACHDSEAVFKVAYVAVLADLEALGAFVVSSGVGLGHGAVPVLPEASVDYGSGLDSSVDLLEFDFF